MQREDEEDHEIDRAELNVPVIKKRKLNDDDEELRYWENYFEARDPVPCDNCREIQCICEYPDETNWEEYEQAYLNLGENNQATGSTYLYNLGPAPGESSDNEEYDDDTNSNIAESVFEMETQNLQGQNNNDFDWDYDPDEEILESIDENGISTVAYVYSRNEVTHLYQASLKIKQVIAGQPITRGGSKCTDNCDIENHHAHNYCKLCKRNLFSDTIVHNCKFGFGQGDQHPEMDPKFLVNQPWWKIPFLVQQEEFVAYAQYLERILNNLSFYIPNLSDELIAELD